MTGDLLFAFFIGAPAVVAAITGFGAANAHVRLMLRIGGVIFSALAAVYLVPILMCDGTMLDGYADCAGGDGVTAAMNAAQPVIRTASFLYIMAGPPLAILGYVLDWRASRRANA